MNIVSLLLIGVVFAAFTAIPGTQYQLWLSV